MPCHIVLEVFMSPITLSHIIIDSIINYKYRQLQVMLIKINALGYS